ncbi:hypothetical protein CRE_19793 [Caenorhabditis remanei]|uniref:BTB domain-containing protein n=1 Tax=Caenorhabditis remanei TaxID=31234 RepID=E3MTB9_CAERE|nr:hypothetical protein CRE_19793 [Caenorhabditis remanei]
MSETPAVSIYEETFAPSVKTDAILLVDGKKMHVNKALLSYHSVRFKALFNSDSDEESIPQIPIEEVEFEDFATLLSLLQDNPIRITKDNAENLLELADRFLLPGPKSLVELFILTSPEFERIRKLEISAKSDKTDAILVVEGKKIHVNKALLSCHSDYFKTLFNGESKEKSMPEIEIKDVNFEDFATLLSLLQDNSKAITKQNTENLLELADRFLLLVPKSQVENFIWTSSEFERIEKLKLADKYEMGVLLKRMIALYTSPGDFSDFTYKSNREISLESKIKMPKTPEVSIYESTFAPSGKTDAILVVDGKKLHVNKSLLSYHSDYFNTLFNGEFKEKSMPEISIEDVDSAHNKAYKDFQIKMSETPEVSIYESIFAPSGKTDAILVVDGKKLHVNKSLLSYHSDYFNTLFNGEFKEKSMPEISIEDVDFEDFATLLSLVHHNPMELSDSNAEDILKLSDRFLLPAAKRHVELFIWTSSEFSSLEKLTIADKYNLDTLLHKTLDWFEADRDAFYEFRYGSGNHLSTKLKSRLFEIFTEKHIFHLFED